MKAQGKVIRYEDNVDTDVIIPARYLNSSCMADLAGHCMEDLDPGFTARVRPGDIIVAGQNFGCGSSREHAPLVIKENGVSAVVAKSFARIFYRNAINVGLPIIESDIETSDGDEMSIDFDAGVITNITTGESAEFASFPPFLQTIISAGGLLKAIDGGKI